MVVVDPHPVMLGPVNPELTFEAAKFCRVDQAQYSAEQCPDGAIGAAGLQPERIRRDPAEAARPF